MKPENNETGKFQFLTEIVEKTGLNIIHLEYLKDDLSERNEFLNGQLKRVYEWSENMKISQNPEIGILNNEIIENEIKLGIIERELSRIKNNVPEPILEKKTDLTNRQKTLVFHYLLKEIGVLKHCDKSVIARFIQSVTGIEPNTKIRDTTLYKNHLRDAGSKAKTENQNNDLLIVKEIFESLKLSKIASNISNDMIDFSNK